jgi:hypothetical protein
MRAGAFALTLIATLASVSAALRADVVERRGGEPALIGSVTGMDEAGVSFVTDGGAEHLVPWDRVRRVDVQPPPLELERWMPVATDLWRARSRVERGDAALAEPLFERLFERYRGRTHETALVVAEGLARCRLTRGANASAVIPVLEVARLERAGVRTGSFTMLPPLLDVDTRLCPELFPAWVNTRGLEKLERDLAGFDAGGDEVVAAMTRLYLSAVRQQTGAPDDASLHDDDHPGVTLLARVVRCGAADPQVRDRGRADLAPLLTGQAAWSSGWAHFAVGASLVREPGTGRRQRGVVQLVHLPAQFRTQLPYLSGLALAWAVEAASVAGDTATADTLRGELNRLFPTHPAVAAKRPVVILPPREDTT